MTPDDEAAAEAPSAEAVERVEAAQPVDAAVEPSPETGAAVSAPAKRQPRPAAAQKPSAARKPAPARKPAAAKSAAEVKPAVQAEPAAEVTPAVEAQPEVAAPEVVAEEAVEPGGTPPTDTAEEEPAAASASPAAPAGGLVGWARRIAAASGVRRAEREQRAESGTALVAKPKLAVDLFAGAGAPAKKGPSTVLLVRGLTKRFDDKVAVDSIDLEVKAGDFYGIVGPNGAGKTTTLSMITGLLRPDAGTVVVNGSDVWTDRVQAKRMMGVLPDRLRLFDRLTGAQLLYYAGVLRGLDHAVVRQRTADLAQAFGLESSLGRLVSDYSAGMTKKIALAAAMIHSPRLLVLDEPFESVDPVSAATVTEILKKYVAAGGTVVLSSHSMDLVQRICDHVAVVVRGEILANGTVAEVRNGQTLEERFVELAGGRTTVEGLEWLHSFSD